MNTRLQKVLEQMKLRNLPQLIISDHYSIRYLTGVNNDPGERLYALYINESGRTVLFASRLFRVFEGDFETVFYEDTDDMAAIVAGVIDTHDIIGIDKNWPARFLLPLMKKCPKLKPVIGSDCVDYVRSCKDEQERELMRVASRINDSVIEKARDFVREGMTEKQVARFIDEQYLKEGAEGNSFTTIVSFGANAADPHHEPDDTVLKNGECVLIDMGCIKDGYCSDMTRTFFYGSVTDKEKEIYELVRKANEKAESIIRPGIRLCDIDDSARSIISNAGYGKYFTHRLGHFIGMSVHEKPDVSSAYEDPVEPGMIFSIEPGIYLSGDFGVRIEDLVLVTEDGCEVLNHVDKRLQVISK